LIAIFDKLLPKTDFIQLPGDEIVEKKHANVKILTAQMESADLSKRKTRKWPGLGPNVFAVDYAELFDHYKEFSSQSTTEDAPPESQRAPPVKGAPTPVEESAGNELTSEVEVMNTDHHKVIIKARNEFYNVFKTRFESSIKDLVSKYDALRMEEINFSQYWSNNLKEITVKHI